MERGKLGDWDEGAVWFAAVHRIKGKDFMWYKGTGTNAKLESPNAVELSKTCRIKIMEDTERVPFRRSEWPSFKEIYLSGEAVWSFVVYG
jgi:hypothetical protein